MTGNQKAARRRKVAEGIAALINLSDDKDPVDFDDLSEEDQADATALARNLIKVVDGLLEPLLEKKA